MTALLCTGRAVGWRLPPVRKALTPALTGSGTGRSADLEHVEVVVSAQEGDDRARHCRSGSLQAVFTSTALRQRIDVISSPCVCRSGGR